MTMISSYYAQVGVKIDKKSIRDVSTFLGSIEKTLAKFQNKLSTSTGKNSTTIRVGISLDKGSLGNVRNQLKALSKNLSLNISQISLSRQGVNRAVRGAVQNTPNGLRLNASLSASSIQTIRSQVQNALTGLNIGAPRVRNSAGQFGGRSTSARGYSLDAFSAGGVGGALFRSGIRALPLVGGALGLQSLTGGLANIQNAEMAIRAQAQDPNLARQQLEYLRDLGNVHGVRVQDIAPAYSQLFAASQGTVLEPGVQQGFKNFLQYASVIGLNSEQKKGSLLALSQIVGKGGKNFAQELNLQLVNQGIPNARKLFAEAVSDGDLAKFEKMMANGEVGLEGVQKFLDLLGKKAQPFLNDFYESIVRNAGRVKEANEEWMNAFSRGGATAGIVSFFKTWQQIVRDSIPYAEKLGNYFERAAHLFNAALLVPGEVIDYFSGRAGSGNFLQTLFGDVENNDFVTAIKKLFDQISAAFNSSVGDMSDSVTKLTTLLNTMSAILTPVLNTLTGILEIVNSYNKGGTGLAYYTVNSIRNKQLAEAEAAKLVDKNLDPEGYNNAVKQAYGVLQESNIMPESSALSPGLNPGSFGSYLSSKLFGAFGKKNLFEDLPQSSPQSIPQPNPSDIMRIGPQYVLMPNGKLEIVHSGSIDTPASQEQISGQVQEVMDKGLRQAITQSASVPH